MAKEDFNIIIMHGHTDEYKTLAGYIEEAGHTPRVLIDEYKADTIFNHLRDIIWEEIHCAIVLLTADDEYKGVKQRARQNVVFELGYCFGAFDSLDEEGKYHAGHAIIVIAEKGVELFSDIDGLKRIEFEEGKIANRKEMIMEAINEAYKRAKKFYPKTCGW